MLQEVIISFFLFSALYFEVFMLLTLLERKGDIVDSPLADTSNLPLLPSVTVVVPCYNEEKTVARTVDSLLALDYPKEKLFISIVDDGSKDRTWEYVNQWKDHPQISLHHKENGGKYTALNYGLQHATTDLAGCLDADSFVAPDALRKIVAKFQSDPTIMAVAPAVKIWKPDSLIRSVQYVEYVYGILAKKLFSFLGAIHVTPGPFSIFRCSLFKEIGYFRHAHNTEDMEIAMRMQKYKKKIENCHDAYVYTVGPKTAYALHKQRLRWTHGFMRNALDYRSLFFNRDTGNVGFLTLPFSVIGIIGTIVSFTFLLYSLLFSAYERLSHLSTLGWRLSWPVWRLEWFFTPVHTMTLITSAVMAGAVSLVIMSRVFTHQKMRIRDIVFYFILYPFLALTWILRSVYTLALARSTTWR